VSEQVHDSHGDVDHSSSAPSEHGADQPNAADAHASHVAPAQSADDHHAHGDHAHADHAASDHDLAVHTGGHEHPVAASHEEESASVAPAAEDEDEDVQPIEEFVTPDEPPKKSWYILKVQSNREDSIRDGLQRRVAVAGLDRFFGDIIVPTEMVSEFKGGKKRVVKRKLYPGYLVVHMEINEETWFLVRETPGIGDFTGSAGKPSQMSSQEVARIVAKQEEKSAEAPKLKIDVKPSDRVKINEGTFENFEGEVDTIDEANGRVTVMINIFGRSTPVELEYWQIEKV
jgi:transcription termination/antitermination protein NusG